MNQTQVIITRGVRQRSGRSGFVISNLTEGQVELLRHIVPARDRLYSERHGGWWVLDRYYEIIRRGLPSAMVLSQTSPTDADVELSEIWPRLSIEERLLIFLEHHKKEVPVNEIDFNNVTARQRRLGYEDCIGLIRKLVIEGEPLPRWES